jgi:hypothetical protein
VGLKRHPVRARRPPGHGSPRRCCRTGGGPKAPSGRTSLRRAAGIRRGLTPRRPARGQRERLRRLRRLRPFPGRVGRDHERAACDHGRLQRRPAHGAVLTQHPGLCRAVVAMVPVMDMLRVELHPNGAFNVTEYGTVEDPGLFRAMRAYSPYHNVEDGAAYPAVLLTVGEFDPRFDAYHAKKMAAPSGSDLIQPASAPPCRVGRARPRKLAGPTGVRARRHLRLPLRQARPRLPLCAPRRFVVIPDPRGPGLHVRA